MKPSQGRCYLFPWSPNIDKAIARQNDMCAQWRLRSASAFTQSDHSSLQPSLISLHCPHKETLDPWLLIERTARLISLGGFPGLSASSPYTWFILFVVSCSGSIALFPCCPNSKLSIPMFPVPQNVLLAPIPLFPWNKCLCSRVAINPDRAHQLGRAYITKCKELYGDVRCLFNGTGG